MTFCALLVLPFIKYWHLNVYRSNRKRLLICISDGCSIKCCVCYIYYCCCILYVDCEMYYLLIFFFIHIFYLIIYGKFTRLSTKKSFIASRLIGFLTQSKTCHGWVASSFSDTVFVSEIQVVWQSLDLNFTKNFYYLHYIILCY